MMDLLNKKSITLVVGGCKSGKSNWALSHTESSFESYAFLATAEVSDSEMAERVRVHQMVRGPQWELVEEPLELADVLENRCGNVEAVLIDCLTVWLSNVLLKKGESEVQAYTDRLLEVLGRRKQAVIMVANEVGTGIVPEHRLGRTFRDLAGVLNQHLAALADCVVYVIAGLPVSLK